VCTNLNDTSATLKDIYYVGKVLQLLSRLP
jgi:hypothetical protein